MRTADTGGYSPKLRRGTVRTQNGGLPQVPTQELFDHSRDGRTGWAMAPQKAPRMKQNKLGYRTPGFALRLVGRVSLSFLALCGTYYFIGLDTPIAKGTYSEP